MQESIYKSYDDLPMFLNARMVAGILGVSPGSAYELMHDEKFPSLRIGNRWVVPKEHFITRLSRLLDRLARCIRFGKV